MTHATIKTTAAKKVAKQLKAVRANADAYAHRLISHAEFQARNAAVWSAR